MRVLDLFAGIGGFSLGLERAGMTTVGMCEIDPFCRQVLRKHWPEMWIHDDVRTLTTPLIRERCGHIDLIAGGFPCQDLSTAGKGAGLDGERSGLWWELCGIIARLRPRWLLIENVPALRTRGADRVLSCLEGIGYSVWPLVVGAWAVGAPHRRDRVWIVGRLANAACRGNDEGRAVPVRPGRSQQAAADTAGASEQLADADERGRRIDEPQRQAEERTAAGRASEALADSERDGRRARCGEPRDEEGQGIGRREFEGSGELADTTSRGLRADGSASRDTGHADEPCAFCGYRFDQQLLGKYGCPNCEGVGLVDSECPRLEGQRPDAGQPQIAESRDAGTHQWPARPGEPQHEWEEKRLHLSNVSRRIRSFLRKAHPSLVESYATAKALQEALATIAVAGYGQPVERMGGATTRLSIDVVRRNNRLALKAYGNAVVPQVVEAIGRAILEVWR